MRRDGSMRRFGSLQIVHWHRNIFSHFPSTKIREIEAMLKAESLQLTYGTSFTDNFAGVPSAIDKILKGAKPAEMPFQVIARREFVINLKSASALGLTSPPNL